MQFQAHYWSIILLCTLLSAICRAGIVPHMELDDQQPGVTTGEDSVTELPGEEDPLSQRQVRYHSVNFFTM